MRNTYGYVYMDMGVQYLVSNTGPDDASHGGGGAGRGVWGGRGGGGGRGGRGRGWGRGVGNGGGDGGRASGDGGGGGGGCWGEVKGGRLVGEGVPLMLATWMRFWLLLSRVSCVLLCPSLLLLLLLLCYILLLLVDLS